MSKVVCRLPDLQRLRLWCLRVVSTGIVGAGDGENHSSMTSCGIRALVTVGSVR